MPFREIPLDRLVVNRANDRHGELATEDAAISELFRLREAHMRKLAEDITSEGKVYDPPLVCQVDDRFFVFDGNRRVTCLKLLDQPKRAPSRDLQDYFRALRARWVENLPRLVECQVEQDREIVDSILFRRHTGSQGGVGQSGWDDRAKRNFVERTGRGGRIDVADEVEALLADVDRLPDQKIPRSTLNRLLSSEPNRARVGVSVHQNSFRLLHDRQAVISALSRVADDLASRRIVLGDLWNNEDKLLYLNRLEDEGVLPAENQRLPNQGEPQPPRPGRPRRGKPRVGQAPQTFIPPNTAEMPWRAGQDRVRAIWSELQVLRADLHPNAVSALMRMLLELSVEQYAARRGLQLQGTLARDFRRVATDLNERNIIDQDYFDELDRMRNNDELISISSMQRYVHSEHFAPLGREITAYWTRLGRLLISLVSH